METRPAPAADPTRPISSNSPSHYTQYLALQKEFDEYRQAVNKQLRQVEYELRKELSQEFSERLVEIENEHRDELAETAKDYESMMEERIRAIQKSVKKSRKRRRAEDDDIDEGNKENVISEMEAQVKELEDKLAKERSRGETYEAKVVALDQQIQEQSTQITAGKKREEQLKTATDTLREQVLLALEESKTSSGRLQELQSDLMAKERAVVAAEEAARRDMDNLQQTLDMKDKRLRNLEDVVSAFKEEVADLQRQVLLAVESRTEREDQIAELKKTRSCLENEVRGLEAKVVSTRAEGTMEADILQERISELQREIEVLTKTGEAEKASLKEAVTKLEEQQKSNQGSLIEDLRHQIRILEEDLVVARQEDTVCRLTKRVAELEVEVDSLACDKEEVTKRMEARISEVMKEGVSECARLQGLNLDFQRSAEALQAEKESLESLCQSLKEAESSLRSGLQEAQAENEQLATLKAQSEGSSMEELMKLKQQTHKLELEVQSASKNLQDHEQEHQEELRKQRQVVTDLEEERKKLRVACEYQEQRVVLAEARLVQADEVRNALELKCKKLLEGIKESKAFLVVQHSKFLDQCSQFSTSSETKLEAMSQRVSSLRNILENVRAEDQWQHQKLIEKEEEKAQLESALSEEKAVASGLSKVVEKLQSDMKTLRAKHSTELDLSKVVEKLQSEKESLKAEHSTELASIREQNSSDLNDFAAQVCDLQQRLTDRDNEIEELKRQLQLKEDVGLNHAREEEEEEHIYEEPPELSIQDQETIYDSVLDDTITSKSVKSANSFTDGMQSMDSTAELDRSKPYVPVLERSSQLMEDSEVDTSNRVVIDANPIPLRKKAAKRKRKQEKLATDEGCKRGKYQLRSRNKNSSSVTPPPEATAAENQTTTPTHEPAISAKASVTGHVNMEVPADDGTPTTLARLKKGWTSGKKALAGVRSKRKLRKQDVVSLTKVESPMEKRGTKRADIRLGGKVRRVQQT